MGRALASMDPCPEKLWLAQDPVTQKSEITLLPVLPASKLTAQRRVYLNGNMFNLSEPEYLAPE